jgi:exodeoxyribonuclease-3
MRFRAATFNVLYGGEVRFGAIVDLVKGLAPDLLVLQECLGWEDGQRLGELARALGLPSAPEHALLARARPRGSGKRYHVGVLSRAPLEAVQVYADPALQGHALARFELTWNGARLDAFGTHFDSHHENLRFVEARFVRSLLPPAGLGQGLHLLAGDLNSLSPADPYPPDLAERVKAAGTDKYGHPPRFEVLGELLDQGWVDALRQRMRGTRWASSPRDRGGVHIDYRVDYVLCSPALAGHLLGAEVIDARGASDHDPLVADFDL